MARLIPKCQTNSGNGLYRAYKNLTAQRKSILEENTSNTQQRTTGYNVRYVAIPESTRINTLKPITKIPITVQGQINDYDQEDNNNDTEDIHVSYEDAVKNDQTVSDFFKYDVLPRFRRENPKASSTAIDAVKRAYDPNKQSTKSNRKGNNWLGYHDDPGMYKIYGVTIKPEDNIYYNAKNFVPSRSTIVHENTHQYRQGNLGRNDKHFRSNSYEPKTNFVVDALFGEILPSGYNEQEATLLNQAYPFDWDRDLNIYSNKSKYPYYKTVEGGTSNAEMRFRIWNELRKQLGRNPTLEETDKKINETSNNRINLMLRYLNGYTYDLDTDPEKVKKAMIHVAQNQSNNTNNYA